MIRTGERLTKREAMEAEILRIRRVLGLVPDQDSYLKYGLTTDEMGTIPIGPRIQGERLARWQNAINTALVILRRRDAETPEKPISLYELREAVQIAIDEDSEIGDAYFVLQLLEEQGLIEFVNDPHWRVTLAR